VQLPGVNCKSSALTTMPPSHVMYTKHYFIVVDMNVDQMQSNDDTIAGNGPWPMTCKKKKNGHLTAMHSIYLFTASHVQLICGLS